MSDSKKIDDGGPAFSHAIATVDGNGNPLSVSDVERASLGVSLRDYFAGQALAGICANSAWNDNFHVSVSAPSAQAAYAMADAMIAARKAGG